VTIFALVAMVLTHAIASPALKTPAKTSMATVSVTPAGAVTTVKSTVANVTKCVTTPLDV